MIIAIIAVIVIAIDQITKYIAHISLAGGGKVDFIRGLLSFTYTENRGAAFGIMQNNRIFFIIVTVISIILISYIVWKKRPNGLLGVTFGLILGGAVGNLIDRVFLAYVRDFLCFEFIDFPIFNIADSAISIGATILIIMLILNKEPVLDMLELKEKADE